MGLDSIELLIEVENAFEIKIPDSQAEKIITVGDFHSVVWNHLAQRHSNRCNSQILFYKLRSYFISTYGIQRNCFTPTTLLNDIVPEKGRRIEYSNFQTNLHLTLPELVLTKPWNTFLDLFGIITIVGSLLYTLFMAEILNHTKWLYLLPVTGIVLTALISQSLNFKRVIIFPLTVKDFTEKILALNFSLLAAGMGVNRKEVEMVINQIIVDKCGLDPEEVTPEKKISDDLGIS